MMRDLFVAIEGIDGAGKSTAVEYLGRELERLGLDVLAVQKQRPPARSPYVADHLRRLREAIWTRSADRPVHLLGELHWIHLHTAYLAALAAHLIDQDDTGAPRVVLVDGWTGKLAARVATNGIRGIPEILRFFDDLRAPDAVVLLDVPPALAAARRKGRHTRTEVRSLTATEDSTFESYQESVRAHLLQLAAAGNWWVHSDQGRSPRQLAADLAGLLEPALNTMRVIA
ncbi:MAG TPA: hypothetical protein VH912_04175 [Streptosporangiaceae bacterium]|jgi:thymidylate kinase